MNTVSRQNSHRWQSGRQVSELSCFRQTVSDENAVAKICHPQLDCRQETSEYHSYTPCPSKHHLDEPWGVPQLGGGRGGGIFTGKMQVLGTERN